MQITDIKVGDFVALDNRSYPSCAFINQKQLMWGIVTLVHPASKRVQIAWYDVRPDMKTTERVEYLRSLTPEETEEAAIKLIARLGETR